MKSVNILFSKEFGIGFWGKITTQTSRDSLPWKLLNQKISKVCQISSDENMTDADILIGFNILPKNVKSTKYIVLLECPSITPTAYMESTLSESDHIFSWSKEQLSRKNVTKLFFPQNIPTNIRLDNYERKKFSCIISGNKNVRSKNLNSLYGQRINTIRWFEKNHPHHFDLYGRGWNMPAAHHNRFITSAQRLVGKIGSIFGITFFPSYLGEVTDKIDILSQYKFCFCYENASIYEGYVTEKIFDCFFAGCIPVYWGAPDIQDYIPENCYIDRRKFQNHEQLFEYLTTLTDSQLEEYQQNIHAFLQSDKAVPFSAEYFATTITNQILQDIGRID